MKTHSDGQLLRIFVNESDRWEGRPLYEAIIRIAREQGMSGATALRAIEGYGASGRVHTVKVLRLSEDLPIVVEILDQPEKIARFLPTLDKMIVSGVVTVEKMTAFHYKSEAPVELASDDEIQLDTSEYVPTKPKPVPPAASATTTNRTAAVMNAAKESAAEGRRVFIDSIDVLLAMLCETKGLAERVLVDLGVDCRSVKRSLREVVSRDEPSSTFLTALEQKSQAAARWLGHDELGPEHLLLALCEIRPSAATDVLMRLGAQPRDICKHVLESVGSDVWQRWLADHPTL